MKYFHEPPFCWAADTEGAYPSNRASVVQCVACEIRGVECTAQHGVCPGKTVGDEFLVYNYGRAECEAAFKLECPVGYDTFTAERRLRHAADRVIVNADN